MTAYYTYCSVPDPTFIMLAQYYLNVEAGCCTIPYSNVEAQNKRTPKQRLYDGLLTILWEIEDISTFFLTALHLEPTDSPDPHLTLEHPTHMHVAPTSHSSIQGLAPTRPTPTGAAPSRLNPMATEWTPGGSIPIAPASVTPAAISQTPPTPRHLNPATSVNFSRSRCIAQEFCIPTQDIQRIVKEILPPGTWLSTDGTTFSGFCYSIPIQRLLSELPDQSMFYGIFDHIPRGATLTPSVCTILVSMIWRQTRLYHVRSALTQASPGDRFIAKESIADCYGHFCGYEDSVLHALLHESLENLPALGERSSVVSALETIITTLSSVASDLLRSELLNISILIIEKQCT